MKLGPLFAIVCALALPCSLALAEGDSASPEAAAPISSNAQQVAEDAPIIDGQMDTSCNFTSEIGKDVGDLDPTPFGTRPVMFIHIGEPVTMDFSPARVNIILDQADRIANITCG